MFRRAGIQIGNLPLDPGRRFGVEPVGNQLRIDLAAAPRHEFDLLTGDPLDLKVTPVIGPLHLVADFLKPCSQLLLVDHIRFRPDQHDLVVGQAPPLAVLRIKRDGHHHVVLMQLGLVKPAGLMLHIGINEIARQMTLAACAK